MIEATDITRIFHAGKQKIVALNNISLRIPENSFTVVKGPSGCGKSTLLFTLGGMLKPTTGHVSLLGKSLYELPEVARKKLTAKQIGFVFQSYYLLPYLTVMENIQLQNKLPYIQLDQGYISELIEKLQLTNRVNHKPAQLSVGEIQRVALVRALASRPKLIFADEPTGNLDPDNSEMVISFLHHFQKDGGTVVMVTHGSEAVSFASQVIHLRQGMIPSNEYI